MGGRSITLVSVKLRVSHNQLNGTVRNTLAALVRLGVSKFPNSQIPGNRPTGTGTQIPREGSSLSNYFYQLFTLRQNYLSPSCESSTNFCAAIEAQQIHRIRLPRTNAGSAAFRNRSVSLPSPCLSMISIVSVRWLVCLPAIFIIFPIVSSCQVLRLWFNSKSILKTC